MAKQLVSAHDLMSQMSKEKRKNTLKLSELVHGEIKKQVAVQQASGPNPEAQRLVKALRQAVKVWRRRKKGISKEQACRRVAFEEVSTKQFYRKWRPKYEKRYIPEMYRMDEEGVPSSKHGTTSEPQEMCQEMEAYFRQVYSKKPSKPDSAEKLLKPLRKRQLPKEAVKKLEGKITEEEVRRAIRRSARGKSTGPDGVPNEYFQAMESVLVNDLTSYYNELYDERQLTPNMLMGEIILLSRKKTQGTCATIDLSRS